MAPKRKTQQAHYRSLADEYRTAARMHALAARQARTQRLFDLEAREARMARRMAGHYATMASQCPPDVPIGQFR